ncbi:cytochrome P450 [Nocardia asiatica]|uniref:cytochrome P450 n=1 Tax=Nocardia asiatica TaxID=209252 RepID=UPI003EE0EC15
MDRPDIEARLHEEPGLAAAVVAETLRFDSPAQALLRVAETDVELSGTTIPAGAYILPLVGSANRDPRRFPDPDEFRLDRPNIQDHLTFGAGIHYCIGSALARLEATAALEELTRRVPAMAPAGAPGASRALSCAACAANRFASERQRHRRCQRPIVCRRKRSGHASPPAQTRRTTEATTTTARADAGMSRTWLPSLSRRDRIGIGSNQPQAAISRSMRYSVRPDRLMTISIRRSERAFRRARQLRSTERDRPGQPVDPGQRPAQVTRRWETHRRATLTRCPPSSDHDPSSSASSAIYCSRSLRRAAARDGDGHSR